MKKTILAATIGSILVVAAMVPALSTNAFAQVSAESRVLQAILGLTDQIKQQTTEIKGKTANIIFDLNVKKKFWELGPDNWTVSGATEVGVEVQDCRLVPDEACAFNVESIQLPSSGSNVTAIIVDGVRTDISEKLITTPTNLMIDAGIGKLGAEFSVEVEFDVSTPYTGPVEFNGEKPQGINFCTFANTPQGPVSSGPNPCLFVE